MVNISKRSQQAQQAKDDPFCLLSEVCFIAWDGQAGCITCAIQHCLDISEQLCLLELSIFCPDFDQWVAYLVIKWMFLTYIAQNLSQMQMFSYGKSTNKLNIMLFFEIN